MAFFTRTTTPATTQEQAEKAARLLTEIAGRNRRKRMQKRLDYYYDKQETYLEDRLKNDFKNPDRLKLQKEFYNITNEIIEETAVIYNEEPIREIFDGTEQDAKIYNSIVEESNLNQIMKQVNEFVKLFKTVAVRPVWRDDIIQYDIYTPNIYDVFQDKLNPKNAVACVWGNVIDLSNKISQNNDDKRGGRDPWDENNNVFYYMDDRSFIPFSLKAQGKGFIPKVIPLNDNEGFVNPYGVLTFVTMRDGVPIDQYFLEGGDELISTNEIINVKLTEANFLTKMQAFSVPVRKGASNPSEVLILDPSLTIDVPGDTDTERNADFKFVTPDAKITEIEDSIDKKIRKLAIKNKLSPERFVLSAQKSSGEALQLKALDQAKILKADKPLFAKYEKQLFEMTKIVWNTHNPETAISNEAKLFIDFKEVDSPMTVEEKDNHNIILYSNGLISKKQWLMEENPDIKDEKHAEEVLEEIRIEKKKDMENSSFMFDPLQKQSESDDEDQ